MQAEAKAYWEALDLTYICELMCSPFYPLPRWQMEQAKLCEKFYKRFLWLLICYPEEELVPSKAIDEFWHHHILHTARYHHDCMQLAGRYLHHHPSDPAQDDLVQLKKQFARTAYLYEREFGEALQVYLNT